MKLLPSRKIRMDVRLRTLMDPQERTEQIGRQIRAAREAKNLSQIALARMLPGKVSDGYISGWENGRHRPSAANLENLAQVLDVPVSFFWLDG